MSNRIITYPAMKNTIQHTMAASFERALPDRSMTCRIAASRHAAARILFPSVLRGLEGSSYSLLSSQSIADAVYENAMRYLDSVIQNEDYLSDDL